MKIALVTDVIYPFVVGGSEIRNYEVAKRLVKEGHEVHIFGAKLWDGDDTINIDGIITHGVSRYDMLLKKAGNKSSFDPIILSIKLFFELRKYKFDIIDNLSFAFFNCYSAKLVSKIKKTPLIFTWQQHFGDYLLGFAGIARGTIAKLLEKYSIGLTEFNIASSKTVKKDLIKEGMKKENVKVIYNGVDLKSIKKIKINKKIYDVVFVGRLTYQKNPELLIRALKVLKERFPKIKLLVVGDGNKIGELKELTKNLGLKKNIVFKGKILERKKVYQYMKSSKIFVLPSLFEGFPLVAVEANACGLPLIVTNDKWNRIKTFINGNGVVSNSSPKELAKAIEHLLKNDKLRKKMGREGMKIAEDFDWDIIAGQTESYYKQVIKNHIKK